FLLTLDVEKGVRTDAQEPGAQVRSLFERVPSTEGTQEGFLRQILRVMGASRQGIQQPVNRCPVSLDHRRKRVSRRRCVHYGSAHKRLLLRKRLSQRIVSLAGEILHGWDIEKYSQVPGAAWQERVRMAFS